MENKKDKTVIEWLEELPEEYRERAINQSVKRSATATSSSLEKALLEFSIWEETKEGHPFWQNVLMHYLLGRDLPKLPDDKNEPT